jgi:pimeloyl-ACP methyl ester carboxylesterase
MSNTLRVALVTAGLILTVLLIAPFLVPVLTLEHTVPPEQLADPGSRLAEVNDMQVHFKIAGEGYPAFMLLHGFGASAFSWREVLEPLGTMGAAVAFDRPAFGLTERPLSWERGNNPYAPEAQVALVVGLMDELDIEEAILVGNSAGGAVAVQTALAHPERVQALVLVDAAIYEGGGAPSWIRPLLNTPQMDHLGPLLARQISRRGDAFLESAWYDPGKITPQIRAGYLEPLRAQHWDRALWELTKASQRRDLGDQIEDLAIPSLVVSGDDDRIVPVESSVRLAEQLPSAELVVIPNCGHVPQEECPQPFLEAVTAFVEGLGE